MATEQNIIAQEADGLRTAVLAKVVKAKSPSLYLLDSQTQSLYWISVRDARREGLLWGRKIKDYDGDDLTTADTRSTLDIQEVNPSRRRKQSDVILFGEYHEGERYNTLTEVITPGRFTDMAATITRSQQIGGARYNRRLDHIFPHR